MADISWNDEAVIKQVSNKVEAAIMKCVLIVEADAKRMCPVDTGRLRASITHQVIKIAKDVYQGRVGTNVHYGPDVELGTHKQSAQPYLRPALEKNRAKIEAILKAAI